VPDKPTPSSLRRVTSHEPWFLSRPISFSIGANIMTPVGETQMLYRIPIIVNFGDAVNKLFPQLILLSLGLLRNSLGRHFFTAGTSGARNAGLLVALFAALFRHE
jgi:hypothetical protein